MGQREGRLRGHRRAQPHRLGPDLERATSRRAASWSPRRSSSSSTCSSPSRPEPPPHPLRTLRRSQRRRGSSTAATTRPPPTPTRGRAAAFVVPSGRHDFTQTARIGRRDGTMGATRRGSMVLPSDDHVILRQWLATRGVTRASWPASSSRATSTPCSPSPGPSRLSRWIPVGGRGPGDRTREPDVARAGDLGTAACELGWPPCSSRCARRWPAGVRRRRTRASASPGATSCSRPVGAARPRPPVRADGVGQVRSHHLRLRGGRRPRGRSSVRMICAPARRMPVRLSIITRSRSIQPRCAAASICEYSPEIW